MACTRKVRTIYDVLEEGQLISSYEHLSEAAAVFIALGGPDNEILEVDRATNQVIRKVPLSEIQSVLTKRPSR